MDLVETGSRARLAPWRAGVALGAFAALGAGMVWGGHRLATSAVVDLGPTDATHVQGFREIERDESVYFRWSSAASSRLSLPFRFCGPGSIRLRSRRHLIEPAILTVSVNGVLVGQKSIQARTDHPYDVILFQVPTVACTQNTVIILETLAGKDPRSLGVAIDWVEIRSPSGFAASSPTVLRGAGILVLVALAVFGLGGGIGAALSMILVLAALIASGFSSDPVAGERILRGGFVCVVLTLGIGFPICGFSGIFAASRLARLALLVITVITLVSRLAFLHPQAFYPDYRVHALVQQTLHSQGLSLFGAKMLETQYARSLGLQQVHGHWYPFPYPPGSYVVTEGVLRLFGLDPLDASLATATVAASLIPLLTMAVGLSLGLGEGVSLAGAFFVSLHPLLVRRMALGYFPGLAGQLADAIALLLVVRFIRGVQPSLSHAAFVTLTLATAFLTYTQSIANFGLMIIGLAFIEMARPSRFAKRSALWLTLAATLALSVSGAIFYSRYVPVLENVLNQKPQPESAVLDRLDQLRNWAATTEATTEAEDVNDQYTGTTVNPIRALARLLTRVWRFNGPFLLAVPMGLVRLWRRSDQETQNALFAWCSVCVSISLLAAGLPSPNPFQHLKDLEFVTPLFSLALGVICKRLWDLRPLFGTAFAGAWFVFAIGWYWVELADRTVSLADF